MQETYNQIAQDFIDRVMQEEDGTCSYYWSGDTATTYGADEIDKLTSDVRNDIAHEAAERMSQESVRECEQTFWENRETIFG